MKLWKDYRIQLLLATLAVLRVFAYFYPGYAKDASFAFLQVILIIIVCMLAIERYQGGHYGNDFTSRKY